MARNKRTQKDKEHVLALLTQSAGEVRKRVPLVDHAGEPVDPEKYWVEFRTPTGQQHDTLLSMQSREMIERETIVDEEDVAKSRVVERRYIDEARAPMVYKALEMGLVADARLPIRNKDTGAIETYVWQKDLNDDADVVLRGSPTMLYAFAYMIADEIFSRAMEEVVSEGEASATPQESGSKSEETETV